MTLFEALFNRKPSFVLSNMKIPSELVSEIYNEDLERVSKEINNLITLVTLYQTTLTFSQA